MEEVKKERPWFFSLNKNEDTAVIRLLHTNTSTIEKMTVHKIELGGKKKKVKCLKEDCPLCKSGNKAEDKIYVHLFDYTDNKEKIWERSDRIIPQLEKIQEDWGDLNSVVLRVTRKGDKFPKYDTVPLPPRNYAEPDKELVDQPIAKFYALNRNKEEVETFLKTGAFPERKPFVPREEYLKNKNNGNNGYVPPEPPPQYQQKVENKQQDLFDPFAGM